ncbi:MAG: hypothetical protein PHD30_02865 [Paludibacter sp.]|nr:hypothetical protein [Paludibacter sp.]
MGINRCTYWAKYDSIGKYPTTNWMNEMFRIGKVQNYDLILPSQTQSGELS